MTLHGLVHRTRIMQCTYIWYEYIPVARLYTVQASTSTRPCTRTYLYRVLRHEPASGLLHASIASIASIALIAPSHLSGGRRREESEGEGELAARRRRMLVRKSYSTPLHCRATCIGTQDYYRPCIMLVSLHIIPVIPQVSHTIGRSREAGVWLCVLCFALQIDERKRRKQQQQQQRRRRGGGAG